MLLLRFGKLFFQGFLSEIKLKCESFESFTFPSDLVKLFELLRKIFQENWIWKSNSQQFKLTGMCTYFISISLTNVMGAQTLVLSPSVADDDPLQKFKITFIIRIKNTLKRENLPEWNKNRTIDYKLLKNK